MTETNGNVTVFKRIGVVAAALVSVVTLLGFANAYVQSSVAKAADVQAVAREEGDLNTKLEVINLELRYLAQKGALTSDDEFREEFLRERRKIYLERLQSIEADK